MPKRKRHRGEVKQTARITRDEFEQLVTNPIGEAFWGRRPEQILFDQGDIAELIDDNKVLPCIVLNTPLSMDKVWEEVVKYQWGFGGKPIMPDTVLHSRSEDVYKVINWQGDVVSVAPQFLRPPYHEVSGHVIAILKEEYRRLVPDRCELINRLWNDIHNRIDPIFYWCDGSRTEYWYDPRTDSIASDNGFGVKIARQTSEITKDYIVRLIEELETSIILHYRHEYNRELWYY